MFKTMVQFPAGILATPIMTAPQGEAPALSPVLGMSSPKVLAGTGNFDKGDWQVSTDSTFATTLYNAQGTDDLTFHTTAGLNLTTTLGVDFFARGRQRTTDGTYTPWAVPVRFGLRPEYSDPIFGLRRIFSKKYNRPFVYNIDPEGKIVNISRRYWDTHALYAFAKQSIVISPESPDVKSEMAFVPPCWEKCHVYDNDDGDMVIDLWFSATRQTEDGWFLDPAFARSPNGFLHGTCLTSNPYVIVGGERVWVYCSTPEAAAEYISLQHISNLKRLDPKWHYWSIYERRLLLDLLTAEKASLNTKSGEFGTGCSNTATHSMSWRGFFGFFNVQNREAMIVDGLEWSASTTNFTDIRLGTPQMNNTIIIPSTLPCSNSASMGVYPVDIERGYNPYLGIDLALLGLVKEVRPYSSEDRTTPYGMAPKILIGAQIEAGAYGICVNEMGLFGLCPGYGENYTTCRISKWLD